jgi:nitrite reductase/ring-hydroxylating ferredoxin subunit
MQPVCALEDIPDGGGRDATVQYGGEEMPLMLLREGKRVYAYVNICPHQGRMLNFAPNRFMVKDGAVMCSHHGATFRVTDGACLGGPCRGAPLRPFRTLVQDGRVLVGPIKENSDA